MIVIEVDDKAINGAMVRLSRQLENIRPAMRDVGELLVKSTKDRFVRSVAPDGTPWAPNTQATITDFLREKGMKRDETGQRIGWKKGYRKKDGSWSKRAERYASGKKPLLGASKRLSHEIHYRASLDGVEVGTALEYATTQQFGAKQGSLGRTRRGAPIPWGDIPPRPFLGLSPQDRDNVLAILRKYLLR